MYYEVLIHFLQRRNTVDTISVTQKDTANRHLDNDFMSPDKSVLNANLLNILVQVCRNLSHFL